MQRCIQKRKVSFLTPLILPVTTIMGHFTSRTLQLDQTIQVQIQLLPINSWLKQLSYQFKQLTESTQSGMVTILDNLIAIITANALQNRNSEWHIRSYMYLLIAKWLKLIDTGFLEQQEQGQARQSSYIVKAC